MGTENFEIGFLSVKTPVHTNKKDHVTWNRSIESSAFSFLPHRGDRPMSIFLRQQPNSLPGRLRPSGERVLCPFAVFRCGSYRRRRTVRKIDMTTIWRYIRELARCVAKDCRKDGIEFGYARERWRTATFGFFLLDLIAYCTLFGMFCVVWACFVTFVVWVCVYVRVLLQNTLCLSLESDSMLLQSTLCLPLHPIFSLKLHTLVEIGLSTWHRVFFCCGCAPVLSLVMRNELPPVPLP